jgi:hypothetical protein
VARAEGATAIRWHLHATSEATLKSKTQEQCDFRRAVIAEFLRS